MNVIAIARTGNEEDIIEAFIRHHLEHFSALLIFDDSSTDRTSAIMKAMVAEGAPIRVVHARDTHWPPLDVSTHLMHQAFDEQGADAVAPIDIDEFIELPGSARLRDWVPNEFDKPLQLRWSNFVWARHDSELDDPNPVTRMKIRMPPRTDSCKFIIPKLALKGDEDAKLTSGNHGLYRRGEFETVFLYNSHLALCHYPIRSLNQFISKCVLMSLRYAALPDRPPKAGFQYRKPLDLIRTGELDQLAELMEQESGVYGLPRGAAMGGDVCQNPLNYIGAPLKYSKGYGSTLANIVNLAESLADRVAEMERELLASTGRGAPPPSVSTLT